MKFFRLAALVLGTALCPLTSNATLLAVPNSGSSYAVWDSGFSAFTFSDLAPTSSSEGLFSATLDSLAKGGTGGFPASTDLIYQGFSNPSDYSFLAEGTAHGNITTLSLQIKLSAPVGAGAPSIGSFFDSVTLNGVSTNPAILVGYVTETVPMMGATNFYVYQWTWTGLSLGNDDVFSISAQSSFKGHVSVDTVRLSDVAAPVVPEPTSAALVVCGGISALLLKRRR